MEGQSCQQTTDVALNFCMKNFSAATTTDVPEASKINRSTSISITGASAGGFDPGSSICGCLDGAKTAAAEAALFLFFSE
jgi:hypothetical protein